MHSVSTNIELSKPAEDEASVLVVLGGCRPAITQYIIASVTEAI